MVDNQTKAKLYDTGSYYDSMGYLHVIGSYQNSIYLVNGTSQVELESYYHDTLDLVDGNMIDGSYDDSAVYTESNGTQFNLNGSYSTDRLFTASYTGEDGATHTIRFNSDGSFTRDPVVVPEPTPSSVVPAMTSANTPAPYVVSASSYFGGGYDPYVAFDKVSSTSWASDGIGTDEWLKIDLGVAKNVDTYTINSGTKASSTPISFKLQGSNDNSVWSDLDTQSSLTWTNDEVKTFALSSNSNYRYYRLSMTALGGSRLQVSEIDLLGVN